MGRKKLFIVEEENISKMKELINQLKTDFPKEFSVAFSNIDEGLNYVSQTNSSMMPFGEENLQPRIITKADINTFSLGYEKLATGFGMLEKFFKTNRSEKTKDNADNLRKVQELQKMIGEDMYTVSKLNSGKTLKEALEDIEPKLVEVDQSQLSKTGGNLSSRIPVTIVDSSGKKVKGFFTKESTYDPAATYDGMIEKMEEKYKKEAEPFKKLLRNSRDLATENAKKEKNANFKATDERVLNYIFNESIDTTKNVVSVEKIYDLMVKANGKDKTPSITSLLQEISSAEREKREIKTDNLSEFEKGMLEFKNSIASMVNQRAIYATFLGSKSGDNLDKKNVSTSIVANLLGVPKIIAEAKPMGMVINGESVTGTFMANAEGMDIHHATKNEIDSVDMDMSFDETNGYKDIFDLQVVDYVCGNIDRHVANMTYQYDQNGKFVGVQGFDNDASFGSNVYKDNERKANLPALSQFHYISESMHKKIMEMKPEMLSTALKAQGLAEHAIDAACDRLVNLKSYLERSAKPNTNDPNFKPIKVVKDNEFKNHDFTTEFSTILGNTKNPNVAGYMGYPITAVFKAKDWMEKHQYKEYVQPEVNEVKELLTDENMKNNANDFDKALQSLDKVDKWYIRSSKEFRNLRTGLEGLSAFSEKIKNPPMSLKDAKLFAEKVNMVENYNDKYLEKKSKELGKSEYADERLRFARHLKEFIKAKKVEFADRVVNEISKKPTKEVTAYSKQSGEATKEAQASMI